MKLQISVARGHPRMATESYRKTLKQSEFTEEEYNFGLHLPNVSFELRTVEQLISLSFRARKIPISRICDISEDEPIEYQSDGY